MKLLDIKLARDDYHKRVGNGIPQGSLILIEGGHGSGKSVMCQRMVYGLLQNGYSVTFVSSQMTTVDFIYQMYSLKYPINKKLIDGSLLYIPVLPLISENAPQKDFLEKIMQSKPFYEKDVIVIDSLSSVISKDVNPENIRDFVSFLKRITGVNKVIIFTINPEELDRGIEEQLKLASTIIIGVQLKPFGGDIKNVATIVKYNFPSQNYQKVTVFRVEPNIGFIVEITSIS
jgi:archaeal flagellar protein FlaH